MQDVLLGPPVIDSFSGDFAFLSNFAPSPITAHGVVFPTVEHIFQAGKTLNVDQRCEIAHLATPGLAKRAGRRLPLRPDWDTIRVDVMRWCLRQKFAERSDLANQLVQTNPAILVEGNPWGDRFWGTVDGNGENRLGLLLMERRDELLSGAPPV